MDQTSPEYLEKFTHQIGRLVITVSLFEDDLTSLLSECFCLTALQENALIRTLNTRAKVEMLGRIAALFLSEEELKPITKWCESVKKKLDERNAVIHGSPSHKEKKIHFRSFTGKNKMLGKAEPWSGERVSDLCDAFLTFGDELEQFRPTFDQWIEVSRANVRSELALKQTPHEKSD